MVAGVQPEKGAMQQMFRRHALGRDIGSFFGLEEFTKLSVAPL